MKELLKLNNIAFKEDEVAELEPKYLWELVKDNLIANKKDVLT